MYIACVSLYIYSQSFHNLSEQRAQASCLVSSFMCARVRSLLCSTYINFSSIIYTTRL